MSLLGNGGKLFLLNVARRALVVAVERGKSLEFPLQETISIQAAGAFVTLHCRGRLRGCIGQIDSSQPLSNVVAYCARSAALEDPRFDPVRSEELPGIDIELSVLSPLEEIALQQIEAGKHGLIVTNGAHRGVLLPQVASERHWNRERFLEETCAKAGLGRDAWKSPATRIQAFTAEVFSESAFRPDKQSNTENGPKLDYSIST